jgi:hypothetical protein
MSSCSELIEHDACRCALRFRGGGASRDVQEHSLSRLQLTFSYHDTLRFMRTNTVFLCADITGCSIYITVALSMSC